MSGIMGMLLGAKTAIAAAVDEFFNRVTLLLPGDGTNGAQNNTFLDSSTNNFTITRNGNTTQGTFSPFSQTGWSNFFGGDNSYFTVTGAASLGTGNFTIEAFVYATATPQTFQTIINNYTTFGTTAVILYLNGSDSKIGFYANNTEIKTTNAISLNRWYHVAVVRNSGTITLYLDGVSQSTLSYSGSSSGNGNAYVGAAGDAPTTTEFSGYISNLRVVIGSAVYTSGFTPPTTPLTAITNTSLLVCQDNRFKDNSTNNYALALSGTPSVQAFSPFAPTAAYSAATVGGSGYFDGTGDYLSIASNSALDLGTGDFTVEFWVKCINQDALYPSAISSLSGSWTTGAISFAVDHNAQANKFALYANGNETPIVISTSNICNDAWNHVAVTRSSNTWRCFINGALENTNTTRTDSINLSTNGTAVGADGWNGSNGQFKGFLSSLRVIKGTCLYTSSFTAPSTPLTAVSGTSFLLNFTNAGITDATAKNDLETVGNAQISTTQSKFGGSSMYFDGTGDYLITPYVPQFDMWRGDLTVEGWFYFNSVSNAPHLFQFAEPTVSSSQFRVTVYVSSSVVRLYTQVGTTGSDKITGTTTLSTGQWYYIALTKSGTTFTLYVNGTSQGTSTTTTYPAGVNERLTIGFQSDGGAAGDYFNGYVDDFRVTRGFARTVTSSPTAAFALQ